MNICWPVPAVAPHIPQEKSGSFWEDRGDRRHCGIDIYASKGSEVVSATDGQVVIIGLFTTPQQVQYWNITYHIIIQHEQNIYCRYAELCDLQAKAGQYVQAGQVIGHVGAVLNDKYIDNNVPNYILGLTSQRRFSMLHFEVMSAIPKWTVLYKGGNLFDKHKQYPWINPLVLLKKIEKFSDAID
jgi:murein DD-endopeptidase MepM/ murein hydrolase activator NlpD